MRKPLAFLALAFIAALLLAASEEVRPNEAYTADAGSWSGAYTDIDEDDLALDSAYVCCSDGDSCDAVSFRQPLATPSANPTTGTDEQTIRISLVKTRNNCLALTGQADATYELFIYESGTQRVDLTGGTPVAVSGAVTTDYDWTYSGFSSADGSGVEVLFLMSDNAVGGSNNRTASVEAVEWIAEVGAAAAERRVILVD